MSLRVERMKRPTDLAGKTNGVLDRSVHVPVIIPGSGTTWMHHLAARAWAVLAARCKAETGVVLSSVGVWRPIEVQISGFKRSYLDHFDATLCTTLHQRVWNGVRFYLRRNTLPKAVPGTSEHGWGLAVDVAVWAGGRKVAITQSKTAWAWLKAHVIEHGFSWAYPTEGTDDPHIQYFAGDKLPPTVIEFEQTQGLTPHTPLPVPPSSGALPVPPPPTVMMGDRDADVVALQQHLAALGLYTLKVDGRCGERTVAAIRELQERLAAAGLYTGRIDGVYGPRTRESYMAWSGRPR